MNSAKAVLSMDALSSWTCSVAEHPFEADIDLFFLDELAAIGLRDPFTHGSAELGLFFGRRVEIAQWMAY